MLRTALVLVGIVGAVWLVLVVAAWGLQRHIIYLPDTTDPGAPDRPGVEEVELTTADGLELTAWFYAPGGEPASTVLATPGNAGNRALRDPLAQGLTRRGHAVLLLEYRGYGGNPGRPHEDGLLTDALAAHDHLRGRDDVDEGTLVYLGESIGTGVATALAAARPPAVLVLRSPFPDLAEVGRGHYPFLPVRTLLRERFEIAEQLRGYGGPLLVVAGGRDSIVPTDLSSRVAEEAGGAYVELEGVDHNDRELLDGDEYLDAVDEFVRRALPDR
jgi:uncharacterized protein